MTSNLRMAGIALLLALLGQQNLVSSVQIGEEGTPYPGYHHRAAISGRMQRGIDDDIPPASSSPQLGWRERMMGGMSAMGKRAKAFGEGIAANKHVANGMDAMRNGRDRIARAFNPFGKPVKPDVEDLLPKAPKKKSTKSANEPNATNGTNATKGLPAKADTKGEPADPAESLVEDHKPNTVKKKTTKSAEEPTALATNGTNATKDEE